MINTSPSKTLPLAVLFLALRSDCAVSGWEIDQRLTSNYDSSRPGGGRSVAASEGGIVHVVWMEHNGYREIHYRRSTDAGVTWEPSVLLSLSGGQAFTPSVATSGEGSVHVTWGDGRDGNREIYYRRSTDSGASWEPAQRLSFTPGGSMEPSIAATPGGVLHVVWYDFAAAFDSDIYHRASLDNGVTWTEPLCLDCVPGESSQFNGVAVDPLGNAHVTWARLLYPIPEIWHVISIDNGLTWAPSLLPAFSGVRHMQPPATAANGFVHVVLWTGRPEINYYRSTDWGLTWDPERTLIEAEEDHLSPDVAVDPSGVVHVVTQDAFLGQNLHWRRSFDHGTTWGPPIQVNDDPAHSAGVHLVADSIGRLYVAWFDNRDGMDEVYFKRYVPSPSDAVGEDGTSPQIASFEVYPNPSRAATQVTYTLPSASQVSVAIYDLLGREVRTLMDAYQAAGQRTLSWDGHEESGDSVPTGVYFVQLKSGAETSRRRLTIIR